MDIKVVAKNVRVAFPHLVTPHASQKFPGSKPKFSVNVLLHKKEHAATIKEIDDAVAKIIADEKWSKNVVKAFPYVEADTVVKEDGSALAGYDSDHVVVVAKTDNRPVVKSRDNVTLAGEEIDGLIYGGCRCHVSFSVYPSRNYKKLCNDLRAVKFFADDEPFGNRTPVTDDEFGDEDEGDSVL